MALEKLREIVTASGRPSGMAATIIAIAIMIVSKIIFQSLLPVNESGTHDGEILHEVMFSQPHGITSINSKRILISMAKKVKDAHKTPTFPILSAIVPSCFYKRVWLSPSSLF